MTASKIPSRFGPYTLGQTTMANAQSVAIASDQTSIPVTPKVDTGRNLTTLFMAVPVISTATEALMSITAYKGGAAVVATQTPAVITAGKTFRITSIVMTYFNVATVGSVRFCLRANTGGLATVTSPLVWSGHVGLSGDGTSTAGHVTTVNIAIPDGMEFAAGTGLGITMQGFGAVPTTGAIVGYGKIEVFGFEY